MGAERGQWEPGVIPLFSPPSLGGSQHLPKPRPWGGCPEAQARPPPVPPPPLLASTAMTTASSPPGLRGPSSKAWSDAGERPLSGTQHSPPKKN